MKITSTMRSGLLLFVTLLSLPMLAGTETVLHRFTGGTDGGIPYSNLVFDTSGNLYGTTTTNGAYLYYGVVFELSPISGGGWKQTVLYNFQGGIDGGYPTAGVILDTAGNVYGTTESGGLYGYGTVFEVLHTAAGAWHERVLYSFEGSGKGDGQSPSAGLALDAPGHLYGTTHLGGPATRACPAGCGTVFELTRSSSGWNETLIYSFTGLNGDGAGVADGVALDHAGNLYGTTSEGGTSGDYGTVFVLRRTIGGWKERVLYRFTGGMDGGTPSGGVTLDTLGNLYGVTSYGGTSGYGTVFKLTPAQNGWTETVLNSFDAGLNGGFPSGPLSFDSAGNLYGTTSVGGCCADGVVYELSPSPGGWAEFVVYTFTGNQNKDGSEPLAGVIADPDGNLYGTTSMGGYGPCWGGLGCGIVFQISP